MSKNQTICQPERLLWLLWAHCDSWRHVRRCAILADTHSSWCTTVQLKYRQLVTTCWIAKLSEYINKHKIILFSLQQHKLNHPNFFADHLFHRCEMRSRKLNERLTLKELERLAGNFIKLFKKILNSTLFLKIQHFFSKFNTFSRNLTLSQNLTLFLKI